MTKSHPVFGDAEVHPITGRHIEEGKDALPRDVQVQHHLVEIEREDGKEVADRMRAEIAEEDAKTPAQRHADHLAGKANEAAAAAEVAQRAADEAQLAADEAGQADEPPEPHQEAEGDI